MTYLEESDQALLPNPGYPAYASAVRITGATPVYYKLREEDDWLIDLDALEKRDLSKVKLMWINYPHMPTGTSASLEFFERLIGFAKKHQILICHDNPYSFILNKQPISLLQVPGALDVAIELNSLSKSSNMAGWRIGMLIGQAERIGQVMRFKSNMDSGMFLPVQLAAAKALQLDSSWYDSLNAEYRQRRDKAYALLDLLGCSYQKDQVGLFLWARVPSRYKDGFELSDEVLYTHHVFLTPGGIFGSQGIPYIRISLCAKTQVYQDVINRIKSKTLQ